MNKQEFLNTLRIIFKKANVLDVKSIIDVYEEHFAVGYEKGLNDEQIIKSLGTPKEIYTSYVEAGIITDEIGREGTKRTVNMQAIYARLEEYKALLLPQLPGVAKKASHTLLTVASALTYIVGVLLFIVTPAILFLLSGSWQPLANVTPLPAVSIVTLAGIAGLGLFGGLTCIYAGVSLIMYVSVNLIHCNIGWNELRRYYETNYNYSNFSSYLHSRWRNFFCYE